MDYFVPISKEIKLIKKIYSKRVGNISLEHKSKVNGR